MSTQERTGAEEQAPPRPRGASEPAPRRDRTEPGSGGVSGQIGKVLLLGIVAGLAVFGAMPLASAHAWVWLSVLIVVTVVIFYVYLSPRRIAPKYLLPGTLLLLAFQVAPVLYTASTAFTNYGDAHRGSKADAITSIQDDSVTQVGGNADYALSVATKGDPATGPIVFLLLDSNGAAYVGDAKGMHTLAAGSFTATGGRITAADGYTLLNLGQASQRGDAITAYTVPTSDGAIRAAGITRAYDGKAVSHYAASCDCITDSATGQVWKADNKHGFFVDASGQRLPEGWKVNVGWSNFAAVVTDSRISGHFLSTLIWDLSFAIMSVLVTFALGVGCALALNSDKLRGLRVYRILLVLPYAMPAFAMLLVWSDMFNQDFGLINKLLHLNVDWLGGTWTARASVIIIQLWLGYPYMFLVSTGALQSIPKDLTEAAMIDGASAFARFRRVTLPLLLVALSPLLIASFAFNFNNFNAIQLTTQGGPFPATDSSAGATDLLITYTYRLAFGGSGAQFGLAAAISIYIFAIVAVLSAIAFRRTRRQEEVYS